jgi:fumarate reductase subunit D
MNRRSDEPVYWGLFGAGGMVIAFALPAILACLIIAGITGINTFHFYDLLSHWWGAGAIFVIIALTAWHCLHRIYHGLHDLTIHTTRLHHYVCYGLAGIISVIAGFAILLFYVLVYKQ